MIVNMCWNLGCHYFYVIETYCQPATVTYQSMAG